MKYPALWIVTAFAAGIELSNRWPEPLKLWMLVAILTLLTGAVLIWRRLSFSALVFATLAWIALGGVALGVERAGRPANHVDYLIASGRVDTRSPQRWRGRLREDPFLLPWGRRFEIDLDEMETASTAVPVRGGLRVNLYKNGHAAQSFPQDLRAGDRVEALVRAQEPRNFLDPGAFDLRGYMASQKIDLVGSLRSGELLQKIGSPRPTLFHWLARGRGYLLARLDGLFLDQPERAAVLRAMLLGDRSFVDSNTVTAFQKTSAYHVLVLAGLHVGALVVFVFWICRRLGLSITITSLITLVAVVAYAGIVEDRPPILRAALMATFYLCARPLFRRIDLLHAVALAALALLLWKPSSLSDSSFQLSFAAAGVIGGLAMPWIERSSAPYREGLAHLGDVTRDAAHPPKVAQFRVEMRAAAQWLARRMPQRLKARAGAIVSAPARTALRLWEIALLSAVIQWGMLPLLARDFHRVSIAGPLSNIPAVLLTGMIVPLGFLSLAMTFVWAHAALALAKLLGFCVGMLLATVTWFGRVPHFSYRIPGPNPWLTWAFFAALVGLALAAHSAAARRRNRVTRRKLPARISTAEWGSAAALLGCAVLVASCPFAPRLPHGKLEINVLDVGQGDSIFAAFPRGRTMLIDGGGLAGSERIGGYRSGNDVGEDVVSPYLWSRGIQRLDAIVLTHAHHDHLDGLHSVIENFAVRELWIGRNEDTPQFRSLLAEAAAKHVAIVHRVQGDDFTWDGIWGQVLWPPDNANEREVSNDDSLVLRLSDGSMHFLLSGDIEQRVENGLVANRAPLAAAFLKVPHHGSKTSSTAPFLSAVTPQVAVVSVGESNPFGHPAELILERYKQAGVRLLRTDQDGEVSAITDGSSLTVTAFAEQHAR